eukprot:1157242-Pelagomonas_calceolata.AAC.3
MCRQHTVDGLRSKAWSCAGDNYAAYNKPGAVVDWMARSYPEEHWVLILDSGAPLAIHLCVCKCNCEVPLCRLESSMCAHHQSRRFNLSTA